MVDLNKAVYDAACVAYAESIADFAAASDETYVAAAAAVEVAETAADRAWAVAYEKAYAKAYATIKAYVSGETVQQ